jgi:hypothetical protein
MSIGNHTTWIIIDLDTRKAVTPENDKRQAIHFTTIEAANAYLEKYRGERDWYVITLPA